MSSKSYTKKQSSTKTTRVLLILVWLMLIILLAGSTWFVYRQADELIGSNTAGVGKTDKENFAPIILFAFYDDDFEETSEQLLLVRFNADEGKMNVVCIPHTIETTVKYKNGSLSEQYKYGGMIQLKSSIENLLSIKIDRYVECSFTTLETIVDDMGGIEYTLDKTLYFKNDDGTVVTDLNSGVQTLNGQQVVEYLRYEKWDDSLIQANNRAALATAALNQYCDETISAKMTSVFTKVVDSLDTNVSIIDVNMLQDKSTSFVSSKKPAIAININGSSKEFDSDTIVDIKTYFG